VRNLPFHGYAQNQIWLEIVALAADLLAWTHTLAFTDHEPAPPMGPQTATTATSLRRRTHRLHRPPTTTPTSPRLSLEPPDRHRLGSASQHLTNRPGPATKARRTDDHSVGDQPLPTSSNPSTPQQKIN
jgi:hypothetical protein